MDRTESVTATYRAVMAISGPAVRGWGRLEVDGLEHLPLTGPVLLAGNHDSYWDPIAVGIAGLPRRQIKALAKSSLWKPGLGWILDAMGQIPIDRGASDRVAIENAVAQLRRGACIGVFPEGTTSDGSVLLPFHANLIQAAIEMCIRDRASDGSTHLMTRRCERFANQLQGRFGLPIERVDERFSSVEAETLRRDLRRAGRLKASAGIDDLAAQIILQSYFEARDAKPA